MKQEKNNNHPSTNPRHKLIRIIIVLLSGISLIACATNEQKTSTPIPTPISTIALATASETPTFPSFISSLPTMPPLPTAKKVNFTIFPASALIATDKISSMLLGKVGGTTVALDENYIYWTEQKDSRYLYRISKKGGVPETIATSKYADGRLDLIHPILSGGWIIFADTPMSNDAEIWQIRAVNLSNLSERLILDDNQGKNNIESFNISADGNWVIWTISTFIDNQPKADESFISMLNLNTGEKREVKRTKVNGSVWSVISLSGEQAVVEQDFDEDHGSGCNLYLLNISNGNMQDLSTDGNSSMPQFVYPWVMWKSVSRYDFADNFVIYNLQTSQKLLIPMAGSDNTDPKMDSTRIYWGGWTAPNGTLSIYVFDILKNKTFELDPPSENQSMSDLAVRGNLIAWIRNADFSSAKSDMYLEWTIFK
jgi:hypothetical protein